MELQNGSGQVRVGSIAITATIENGRIECLSFGREFRLDYARCSCVYWYDRPGCTLSRSPELLRGTARLFHSVFRGCENMWGVVLDCASRYNTKPYYPSTL